MIHANEERCELSVPLGFVAARWHEFEKEKEKKKHIFTDKWMIK